VYADLAAIFEQIQPPAPSSAVGADFCALPVPSLERHRVAKDAQLAPAILISVTDAPGESRPASIVLENLTVQHDVDCRITRPGGVTEEGRFTVVRCTGADPTLQSYFLRVAAAVLQSLGATPSRLSVSQAVNRLAELFHAMKEPPRKSLQGLWAELFLIARAHDPVTLARAWHTGPEELFDFSLGSQRIEVKSARGRARRHYFTLEQLQPPVGAKLMIASMLIEPSEAGVSLLELLERTRLRLADKADLVLRIESVVVLTLGESWRRAASARFDLDLAEKSLAFYDPEGIPKINPAVPPGVSDVRFKSDLTGVQPYEVASLRTARGIFRAALRQ
jgi:hypothetical protein